MEKGCKFVKASRKGGKYPMSNITITHLYERVASVLGKETAENVSSFIDFKITEEMNNHLRLLATKVELAEAFAKLRQEIAEAKAEIIKWMFIFWVGQLLVTVGIIQFLIKR
jgi:hypothetical protein